MAYILSSDLQTYGITDPEASNLIDRACRILDLHMPGWPYNDDGFKFPRVLDGARGVPDDEGVIPVQIKNAACEQVLWMLQVSDEFVNNGGDKYQTKTTAGAMSQKDKVESPLLAPLARRYLHGFNHRVGLPGVK